MELLQGKDAGRSPHSETGGHGHTSFSPASAFPSLMCAGSKAYLKPSPGGLLTRTRPVGRQLLYLSFLSDGLCILG